MDVLTHMDDVLTHTFLADFSVPSGVINFPSSPWIDMIVVPPGCEGDRDSVVDQLIHSLPSGVVLVWTTFGKNRSLYCRALCRIKLLPVTRFGGHMDVNC